MPKLRAQGTWKKSTETLQNSSWDLLSASPLHSYNALSPKTSSQQFTLIIKQVGKSACRVKIVDFAQLSKITLPPSPEALCAPGLVSSTASYAEGYILGYEYSLAYNPASQPACSKLVLPWNIYTYIYIRDVGTWTTPECSSVSSHCKIGRQKVTHEIVTAKLVVSK